jgi:hypothetical protein
MNSTGSDGSRSPAAAETDEDPAASFLVVTGAGPSLSFPLSPRQLDLRGCVLRWSHLRSLWLLIISVFLPSSFQVALPRETTFIVSSYKKVSVCLNSFIWPLLIVHAYAMRIRIYSPCHWRHFFCLHAPCYFFCFRFLFFRVTIIVTKAAAGQKCCEGCAHPDHAVHQWCSGSPSVKVSNEYLTCKFHFILPF